jgi:hypothetical protein
MALLAMLADYWLCLCARLCKRERRDGTNMHVQACMLLCSMVTAVCPD